MKFNRLPAFKQILDNVIKRSRDSDWLINLGWESFREKIMECLNAPEYLMLA